MERELKTPGHSDIVRDEKGRMLLNVAELALAAAGECCTTLDWLRRVEVIDRRSTDASSIRGEPLRGTTYVPAGTYVARVWAERYIAFGLDANGRVRPLASVPADEDAAVRLWPVLEREGVRVSP